MLSTTYKMQSYLDYFVLFGRYNLLIKEWMFYLTNLRFMI